MCLCIPPIPPILSDLLKAGFGAALGTYFGARMAHRLQRQEKVSDEKGMVLRRVELLREELAQNVVHIENMVADAKQGDSPRLHLSDAYFKDIPYEVFLKHLGREHVDNIKNIERNVIPAWNKIASDSEIEDTRAVSKLCTLADQTLSPMRSVIDAFERHCPEIGKTTVPKYIYQ
jgi:hypothetical protein